MDKNRFKIFEDAERMRKRESSREWFFIQEHIGSGWWRVYKGNKIFDSFETQEKAVGFLAKKGIKPINQNIIER